MSASPDFLRHVPVFANLADGGLSQLAEEATEVHLSAGDWLFHEGDDADGLFLILSGRLEVVDEGPPEVVIRELRRGDVLGELALLGRGLRTASVRARRDAELVGIGRDRFEQLIATEPSFALGLTRAIGSQLAANRRAPATDSRPGTILIVDLDERVGAAEYSRVFLGALAEYGTAAELALTAETRSDVMASALNRAEESSDHVILACTDAVNGNAWANFCLREADLVVAISGGKPAPGWADHAQSLRGCELFLAGSAFTPSQVSAFRPRQVRLLQGPSAIDEELAVLARRVSGNSLGIVFSGGGARAFAHVGVMEEIEASGLRIDRVAGVSLGSVVGAGVALGHSSDELADLFRVGFIETNPTGDYSFPLYSLIRGGRTRALLEGMLGNRNIEELGKQFFCLSCDLVSRESVVHRSGPVLDAVLASLSIPGVFPPIPTSEGRLLVDGGVLDNLPVKTMSMWGEGPIIAVDVTGQMGDFRRPVRPRIAELKRPVRRLLTGSEEGLPRLAETIVRTVTVGSIDTAEAARRHADLVIQPEVEGVGILEWGELERVREAGRRGCPIGPARDRRLAGRLPEKGCSMSDEPGKIMKRRVSSPSTVLAVASLGVFMAFVDATIVNIAFPNIGESFPDSDISSLSWILNSYNIIFAAFLVAAGKIADLLGRRRVFLGGLIVFTIASVLCAVAPTVNTLIAFRVLQALGSALIVPSSLALVLHAYPAEHRAHAVALLSAIGALAAGIGPTLGGLLVAAESWRLVFLVNLPVGIAAYFFARHYLVESREPGHRRMPDLSGALFFAVAIAALVLGVVQGDEWGWTSPAVLASFVVAILSGLLLLRRSAWHSSPVIDLGLFANRTFSVSNSATILAAAGFYGYTLVNVLYLTGVWQYSILEAGLAITPGPFVAAAVAGPTSRLANSLRASSSARRGRTFLGGRDLLVRRTGRHDTGLPWRVVARNDPPGDRRGGALPEPEWGCSRFGSRRGLRYCDRSQLRCPPGRGSAGRGGGCGDHRSSHRGERRAGLR